MDGNDGNCIFGRSTLAAEKCECGGLGYRSRGCAMVPIEGIPSAVVREGLPASTDVGTRRG